MSATVDERVVQMEFDNKAFEQNAQTTMNTLDELNKQLEFKNGTKGLEDVKRATQGFDVSGIEAGVSSLQSRFSTLGIIGMTAIQNLTNSVIGLGKSLAHKIFSGGINRAMNIEQARFQIEGLDQDWSKLKDDILYGVQDTAYGFDEAAKAAAVMAASGVKAGDEMAGALRGISGLAAMTGSSYTEVADIVGTVAGTGKLMTEQLRQFEHRGLNIAAALTKTKKFAGKTEEQIRDMVTHGDIKFKEFSEAMNEAFGAHAADASKMFSGAVSNVKASLSRIGAAFVSPAIATVSAERDWTNLTDVVRSLIDALKNFETILGENGAVITTYRNALSFVSEKLVAFFDNLAKFKVVGKDLDNLGDTFQGLKDFVLIFVHAFSGLFKAISPAGNMLKSLASAFLAVTGTIGRFISGLEDVIAETGIFNSVGEAIAYVFENINKVLGTTIDGIASFTSHLGGASKVGEGFKSTFEMIAKALGGTKGIIGSTFDGMAKVIETGFKSIESVLSGGSVKNITSIIQTILLGKIADNITLLVFRFKTVVNPLIKIVPTISKTIGEVGKTFKVFQNQIRAKSLMEIAKALLVLGVALVLIASINPKKLQGALAGIGVMMAELFVMLKSILGLKFDTGQAMRMNLIAASLVPLSVAVLILAAAAKTLSGIDSDQIAQSLTGLGIILSELAAFMALTNKTKLKPKSAVGIVILSAAILVIAEAVKRLGALDSNQIGQGLAGLGIILTELAAFMLTVKKIKIRPSSMIGILVLSAALNVIAEAVKKIGSLNEEQLAKGLVSLGAVLLEIAAFMNLISGTGGILLKSVGILILAEAIGRLGVSLAVFGKMSNEQIAKGLTVLAGSLVSIAVAMRIMPWSSILQAVGLVIVAEAVSKLADALDQFGAMSSDSIAKSIGLLAGSLIILTAAMHAMNGALAGAAAMIVMAKAISILTPVLTTLGSMSLEQIGKALIALAGAFAVVGIAAALLTPVIVPMLGLAAAIAALGIAALAVGAGLMFFATGLVTLANSAPQILQAVPDMIKVIKEFIIQTQTLIPEIAIVGLKMVLAFLKGIRDNAPQIIDVAGDIIVLFIQGLTKKIPEIVVAAFDFIGEFVKALIQAIDQFAGKIQEGAKAISAETFKVVSDALLELSAAAFILSHINIAGAISGVVGLIAFANGIGLLLTELGALNKIPGFKEFIESGGELLGAIANGIGEMVGGLIGGIGEGITSSLPNMALSLSQFMTNLQPFLQGAKMVDKDVISSINNITGAVLALSQAKLNDAVSTFLGGGINFADFGDQISKFMDVFVDFADKAANLDEGSIKSVKIVSQAVKALAEASAAIPNSGGVVGWWAGENDLGDFATQLEPFITSFSELSNKAKDIPEDSLNKVKIISEAAKTVIEMASSIPNSGGVVGWWAGENDLGSFAEQLTKFGKEFANLASNVSDISEDSINKAAMVGKAAKALAETASAMPTEEVGWFKTKTTLGLDKFAEQLKPFIEKFKEIIPLVEDINVKSINKISKIAAGVAKIAAISLDDKGIKSFKALSEHLPTLGKNISDYADSVKDANAEQLTAVNKALPSLFKSFSKIEAGTGKNLSELSAQLSSFGRSLKSYAKSISGISAEDISATTDQIAKSFKSLSKTVSQKGNTKGFKSAGKNATEAIVSGFSSGALSRGLNKTLTSALKSIKTKQFSDKGEDCAKAFEKGLKSVKFDKVGSVIIDRVKGSLKSDAFYSMGQNVSQGYANGVLAKAGVVYAAVRHVVHQAYLEGMKAQKSASPSKLYAQMGTYVSEGYANGIVAASGQVSKAVKTMVDKGSKTAKSLTTLKSLMNFDDIGNPTIRPVLDLSNVKMGLNSLDSMMNNSYALGIAGTMPTSNVSSASKNITFNNRITVDGTSDPAEWADEFMQELEIQARTL